MSIPIAPRIERDWHDLVWFPRDYQRDQLRINLDDLLQQPFLRWEGKDYEDREHQNEPWRQLAGVVPHTEHLHRFTDRRWLPFEGKPLPDGSNIGTTITLEDGTQKLNGSPELLKTFVLYRHWLEFLHLDALLALDVEQNPRTKALTVSVGNDTMIKGILTDQFFRDLRAIAMDERKRIVLLDKVFKQYDPDQGLGWIFHWRKTVVNQLHYILAAAEWAADTASDEAEHAMLEEFENFSPLNQVIVAIVYKEASFEKRLRIMHVEDEHFMKRVRLVETAHSGIIGRSRLRGLEETYLNDVLGATRIFQECLRNLFSFRQLRDWGYGRPWRKMHLVFDTENRPLFKSPVNRIKKLVTSNSRAKDLFGVYPVEKSSLKDEECMVCLEEWLDHDLVIETRCQHFFHAACVIRFWDQEYKFGFRCPLCRTSGGRIRDRVDFPVEGEDFGENPEDVAAYQIAMAEVARKLREKPNLRPVDFPEDAQYAMGLQMESVLLQTTLRAEGEGEGGFLPLP